MHAVNQIYLVSTSLTSRGLDLDVNDSMGDVSYPLDILVK